MKKNIFLLTILSSLFISFESSAMRILAVKTGGNAASQLAMFSAGAKKARTQIGNSTTEERIKRIVKNSIKKSIEHTQQNYYRPKKHPKPTTKVNAGQVGQALHKELIIVGNAQQLLGHVEGFEKTVESFEKAAETASWAQARGASFELETAIKVEQEEEVIGLGLHQGDVSGSREMDIITRTRNIECKTVYWQQYSFSEKQMKKARQAFIHQKKISTDNAKKFEIHSEKPFTEPWKTWLNQQNIKY